MSHAEFFGKTANQPGDSAPLQPRFGVLQLLTFHKTQIVFEREEISDCRWDSGKYDGAADGDWENYVTSQGAYLEGDWGVIVLCTMFLVFCSINVSIFHIIWLDTFWTDLVYPKSVLSFPFPRLPPEVINTSPGCLLTDLSLGLL